MSSIIEGYSFDVFISYRQKDNKHDGWVTEFVNNLKGELESTFKEEISVYFDINPHDGLLETHDVDASLKEKLKCLIFIPIISRTYCDPKSFAWEREFKAFVDQALQDQFGLKVKLPNGNIANRVLPIQIHEIVADDKSHIERELGGILRPIEFIYKEPGVNRPLRVNEDHPSDNLNKTFYRNQINKVANAIDEIINSLKNVQAAPVKEKTFHIEPLEELGKVDKMEVKKKLSRLPKRKLLLSSIIITIMLVVVAIFVYPRLFKIDKLENLKSSDGRISVAVMPFQNMTNDTIWNIWQDIIQDNLITFLSNSEELKIRQIESIKNLIQSKIITNYASITPSVASSISKKLDANVFAYGSISKAGSIIRLNAQLISTRTEEIIKAFQIEGVTEKIYPVIDSLSKMVRDYLIISKLNKEVPPDVQHIGSTFSPEASRYYTLGFHIFYDKRDYSAARNWFKQALNIDSNFVGATIMISYSYGNQSMYDDAKRWCLKAYRKKNQSSLKLRYNIDMAYGSYFETPVEEIKYCQQLLEIDDQSPHFYYRLANSYSKLFQHEKVILALEKALQIYKNWGVRPQWVFDYTYLGNAYHQTSQFSKEKELYRRAELDFPDDPDLIYLQAILSLVEGNKTAANQYIEKYISIQKGNSISEIKIITDLAEIYTKAGILGKAEDYYRQALSLEPDNPVRLNNLAYYVLIDKDRNINEGLELASKALEISPDNYDYLHTKGWGLYKQGKYQEAVEMLQKSWDLRLKEAIYDHQAFLHLEAARKAFENHK